jgi:hypothetical protein
MMRISMNDSDIDANVKAIPIGVVAFGSVDHVCRRHSYDRNKRRRHCNIGACHLIARYPALWLSVLRTQASQARSMPKEGSFESRILISPSVRNLMARHFQAGLPSAGGQRSRSGTPPNVRPHAKTYRRSLRHDPSSRPPCCAPGYEPSNAPFREWQLADRYPRIGLPNPRSALLGRSRSIRASPAAT